MALRIRHVFLSAVLSCIPLAMLASADDKPPDAKADPTANKAEKEDELTPEQLAEQLEFDWQSINIQASRGLKAPAASASRSLSIYGQVKIVKELDILAIAQQTDLTEATDDNGNDLVTGEAKPGAQPALMPRVVRALAGGAVRPAPVQQRYYQFPHRNPPQPPWFGSLNPMGINVNLNLNQAAVPSKLAKVKGTIAILVGKVQAPVDIALAASDEWTELTPDLSLRLTKAEIDGSSIQYQLESRGDDAIKNFHGWVGQNQPLPKTMITKVAFIDEFNQEHEIHTGSAFNPNTSGSAGFGNTGRLRTMRFVAAKDVHEVAMPFEIKDIDVPTFGQMPPKESKD